MQLDIPAVNGCKTYHMIKKRLRHLQKNWREMLVTQLANRSHPKLRPNFKKKVHGDKMRLNLTVIVQDVYLETPCAHVAGAFGPLFGFISAKRHH